MKCTAWMLCFGTFWGRMKCMITFFMYEVMAGHRSHGENQKTSNNLVDGFREEAVRKKRTGRTSQHLQDKATWTRFCVNVKPFLGNTLCTLDPAYRYLCERALGGSLHSGWALPRPPPPAADLLGPPRPPPKTRASSLRGEEKEDTEVTEGNHTLHITSQVLIRTLTISGVLYQDKALYREHAVSKQNCFTNAQLKILIWEKNRNFLAQTRHLPITLSKRSAWTLLSRSCPWANSHVSSTSESRAGTWCADRHAHPA